MPILSGAATINGRKDGEWLGMRNRRTAFALRAQCASVEGMSVPQIASRIPNWLILQ
jgi:hypothetical protein